MRGEPSLSGSSYTENQMRNYTVGGNLRLKRVPLGRGPTGRAYHHDWPIWLGWALTRRLADSNGQWYVKRKWRSEHNRLLRFEEWNWKEQNGTAWDTINPVR